MPATPESVLEHLALANERRFARADIKDRVHADPSWLTLIDLVRGANTARTEHTDEEHVAGMQAERLLTAAPGLGRGKARRLLGKAGVLGVGREVTLAELGPRRRRELAAHLLRNRAKLNDLVCERIAARPRAQRIERTPA